jgi:hypothetical protein
VCCAAFGIVPSRDSMLARCGPSAQVVGIIDDLGHIYRPPAVLRAVRDALRGSLSPSSRFFPFLLHTVRPPSIPTPLSSSCSGPTSASHPDTQHLIGLPELTFPARVYALLRDGQQSVRACVLQLPSTAGIQEAVAPRSRRDQGQGVAVPLGKLRRLMCRRTPPLPSPAVLCSCSEGSWRLAQEAKAPVFWPFVPAPAPALTAVSDAR